MAEVLTAFPVGLKSRHRRGTYDRYLDGQIWQLEPSDHECANVRSLQSALMHRARHLGLLAITRTKGQTVYVQAIRPAQEG